jgi:hypothetical protein
VRLKSTAVFVAVICLFVLGQVAIAMPSSDGCDLPKDLQVVLARKYPGSEVVKLSDLEEDDRKFFSRGPWGQLPRAGKG